MPADHRPIVLVADGSRLVRELIRNALVERRIGVVGARSGRDALERMAATRPDLIVSETDLDPLSGWDLFDAVRRDPHTRDVPFVFLSADREIPSRVRALEGGAEDYLTKPFSTDELVLRIRSILRRHARGSSLGLRERIYLAGHTSHLPIADLLQLLSMNNRTGSLRLWGEEAGRIDFDAGRIVGAATARTRGRKALFRMLGWRSADFHFDPAETMTPSDDLEANTQRLLMDGLVALDDLDRVRPLLPPPDAVIRPGAASGGADGLAPLEARLVALARDEPRTLAALIDAVDETDLDVARALARLVRRGLLVAAPATDPVSVP